MSLRRPTGCRACRGKHLACYSLPDLSPACSRCSRLGIECDGIDYSSAQSNGISELRAEVKRLDSVIRQLESDCQETDLEVSDLASRLTALCFVGEGINGSDKHDLGDDELGEVFPMLNHADGGFIYTPELSTSSSTGSPASCIDTDDLASLIEQLPSWDLMEEALLDLGTKWMNCNEWNMSPRVPREIETMYEDSFSPPPSAQQLADMFALLAARHGMNATSNMMRPHVSQIHQDKAVRYYDLTQRALSLGDFRDAPTLFGIRALHGLIYMDVHCWCDPTRIRRGLIQMPLLMTAIFSLGWNEDLCIEGESAIDRYERQAIVCASIREYHFYSMSYGLKTLFKHSTIRCSSPPRVLSEEDWPLDDKYEDFRAPQKCLQMLEVQMQIALLANELSEDILPAKQCSKQQLAELHGRMRSLRERCYHDTWRIIEDRQTGQRDFAFRADLLPPKERFLRCYGLVFSTMILVRLHESFIFSHPAEAAMHRHELAEVLSDGIASMAECHKLVGAFPSVAYAGYNMLVSAGLMLAEGYSSLPLTPFEKTTCERFLRFYLDVSSIVGLPKPMLVLIRILQHLVSPAEEDRRCKKSRTDCLKRIRKSIVAPVRPAAVRDDTFTFERWMALPASLEDDDLRRKTRVDSSQLLDSL